MQGDYIQHATELLRKLVSIQSFSGEEHRRSNFLTKLFSEKGIVPERAGNNLVVRQPFHDRSKPTLMLNSHIDTVRPGAGYTFNPFTPLPPTLSLTFTAWEVMMRVQALYQ